MTLIAGKRTSRRATEKAQGQTEGVRRRRRGRPAEGEGEAEAGVSERAAKRGLDKVPRVASRDSRKSAQEREEEEEPRWLRRGEAEDEGSRNKTNLLNLQGPQPNGQG